MEELKKYAVPSIEVIEINSEGPLAGSFGMNVPDGENYTDEFWN